MARGLLFCGLLGLARGSVRSLSERQAAGECVPTGYSYETFTDGKITDELPSQMSVDAETGIESADLIEVKYGSNFKVVMERKAKEFYVLTQCGTTKPSQAEVDAVQQMPSGYTRKDFAIPLQTVGTSTTVVLGFFEALGIFDRVRYVSSAAGTSCGLQLLGCGAKANRTEHLPKVDAWFMDCHWQDGCSVVNKEPKGLHVSTTQDPGPLRSAEHIKFIAAFFNKEKAASEFFSKQVSTYSNLKGTLSPKPKVAWIASGWGAFTLSQAHYKLKYVENAGGVNVDGAEVAKLVPGMKASVSVSGTDYKLSYSMANESKPLMDALKTLGVGVVIDETYAPTPKTYTMASFLTAFGLESSSDMDFVTDKMVLRVDGDITPSNGLDWFTTRPARPEWAAEGLARVLQKDASKGWHYFRNVAKDEMPKESSKGDCGLMLPACTAGAHAVAIPVMTTVRTDEASSARVNAAASAGMLLVALFLSCN